MVLYCPNCGERLIPYDLGVYRCKKCGLMSLDYIVKRKIWRHKLLVEKGWRRKW